MVSLNNWFGLLKKCSKEQIAKEGQKKEEGYKNEEGLASETEAFLTKVHITRARAKRDKQIELMGETTSMILVQTRFARQKHWSTCIAPVDKESTGLKGPVENDALLHLGGRQQQQHKDRAGIQKDMRPQEFATQGFAPRQICGTLLLVW